MLLPVVALTVWMGAVTVVLRAIHVTEKTPVRPTARVTRPAAVDWPQVRVDAQFRAMTAPLSR